MREMLTKLGDVIDRLLEALGLIPRPVPAPFPRKRKNR